MKKYIVVEPTGVDLSKYDLEGTEEAVVRSIREAFDKARQKYNSEAEFYLDWSPRQWGDGDDLVVYAKRPETTEERKSRLALKKEREQIAEQRERKLLAELQAKYGNK